MLTSTTGEVVDLAAVLADGSPALPGADGMRGVLLVFLPHAASPVCTAEVRDLRERVDDLSSAGLATLAVTCDALPALRAWTLAEDLPFPVLSDFWPHGAVSSAWGVLEPATGAPRRSSFLVDVRGVVRWSVTSPPGRARSLDDVLEAVRRLPPPGGSEA